MTQEPMEEGVAIKIVENLEPMCNFVAYCGHCHGIVNQYQIKGGGYILQVGIPMYWEYFESEVYHYPDELSRFLLDDTLSDWDAALNECEILGVAYYITDEHIGYDLKCRIMKHETWSDGYMFHDWVDDENYDPIILSVEEALELVREYKASNDNNSRHYTVHTLKYDRLKRVVE